MATSVRSISSMRAAKTRQSAHVGLDIAGCFPGIADAADLIHAGVYVAEGHLGEAALSGGAASPCWGPVILGGEAVVEHAWQRETVTGGGGS